MKNEPAARIYTIGHSRHPIGDFLALLRRYRIERVVDVRGQPYSRRNPQFNRESLADSLKAERIDYTWSGRHLSGRPPEVRFHGPGGEVLWDRLRAKPEFRSELDALAAEARNLRLVMLCAEEDPGRCHRRFLLTPPLAQRGLEVLHIRGDGTLQPESALVEHGAAAGGSGQRDLFD